MRVPLPWLREYCDPSLDVRAIEERLTMTGTKVEAIHHHGVPSPEGFIVGRVLSAEQHPDADRLKLCMSTSASSSPRRSSAARPMSPPGRPSRSRAPARSCRTARSCGGRSCGASSPKG